MKLASLLVCSILIASAGPACSEPLTQKSKMSAWAQATPAEKTAWIADFKFTKLDITRAQVGACMEKRAVEVIFKDNALADITELCSSIADLP